SPPGVKREPGSGARSQASQSARQSDAADARIAPADWPANRDRAVRTQCRDLCQLEALQPTRATCRRHSNCEARKWDAAFRCNSQDSLLDQAEQVLPLDYPKSAR